MGKGKRSRPSRLGEKLGAIRKGFSLSQNEMLRRLGLDEELTREEVSAYERNVREPSLIVLLHYARAAGVWLDVLVDDELELPSKLPSATKHAGVKRNPNVKKRA